MCCAMPISQSLSLPYDYGKSNRLNTMVFHYNPQVKRLKVLTFINLNADTLRLIRKSARIANKMQAELIIMHVLKNINKCSEERKLTIIELEQLVTELGGDFRLAEGENIAEEILKAENKIKPDYIIVGETRNKINLPFFKQSITRQILNKDPGAHVWIVGNFSSED